jgi:glycosyltransferase involved in cell wall biosynthesis
VEGKEKNGRNEMKIASLVWFPVFPARFGGQKGIALFQEHLSHHFPISCICSSDNRPEAQMQLSLAPILPRSKTQFINPLCWIKILRRLRREKVDILLLEHPYHAIAAVLAKKLYGLRLVLHQHNIEYIRFRQLKRWWWPLLKRLESLACRQSDLVFFKTEEDRRQALHDFGMDAGKTFILPYGIERKQPRPGSRELLQQKHSLRPEEKIILFAGTLDYEPNAEAVEKIYSELAPRLRQSGLNYRILICGRNRFEQFHYLNQLHHPQVLMAGEVEDIGLYFEGADVFINPVSGGGGIQTKILDALSHHLPVACFTHMLSGIDASTCPGKLFPAQPNDWNDFVLKLEQAVIQGPLPTPESFFHHNSWKKIAADAAERIGALGKK